MTPSVLTIGSTASGGSNSVLSIVNTNFSATGSMTGLQLAELSLLVGQKPGVGQTGITFNYNLALTFLTPVGSAAQTLALTGSGNGGAGANADDLISGFGALSLTSPLVLTDFTLSNFRFSTVGSDAGSTLNGDTWDGSAQGTTHLLYLLADVTATGGNTSTDAPTLVPEPASFGLFVVGLLGLRLFKRRATARV